MRKEEEDREEGRGGTRGNRFFFFSVPRAITAGVYFYFLDCSTTCIRTLGEEDRDGGAGSTGQSCVFFLGATRNNREEGRGGARGNRCFFFSVPRAITAGVYFYFLDCSTTCIRTLGEEDRGGGGGEHGAIVCFFLGATRNSCWCLFFFS